MSRAVAKEMIRNRLASMLVEIQRGERLTTDVLIGKFWQGKLSALNGQNGEQKFLEDLLDELEKGDD